MQHSLRVLLAWVELLHPVTAQVVLGWEDGEYSDYSQIASYFVEGCLQVEQCPATTVVVGG